MPFIMPEIKVLPHLLCIAEGGCGIGSLLSRCFVGEWQHCSSATTEPSDSTMFEWMATGKEVVFHLSLFSTGKKWTFRPTRLGVPKWKLFSS